MNRRTSLHTDIVWRSHEFKVKVVEDHSHCDRSLHHSELVTDAFALTTTKGQECVIGGQLVGVQPMDLVWVVSLPSLDTKVAEWPLPSSWVELFGILP